MHKSKIMTKYNPVEKEPPSPTNFIADEAFENTVLSRVGETVIVSAPGAQALGLEHCSENQQLKTVTTC